MIRLQGCCTTLRTLAESTSPCSILGKIPASLPALSPVEGFSIFDSVCLSGSPGAAQRSGDGSVLLRVEDPAPQEPLFCLIGLPEWSRPTVLAIFFPPKHPRLFLLPFFRLSLSGRVDAVLLKFLIPAKNPGLPFPILFRLHLPALLFSAREFIRIYVGILFPTKYPEFLFPFLLRFYLPAPLFSARGFTLMYPGFFFPSEDSRFRGRFRSALPALDGGASVIRVPPLPSKHSRFALSLIFQRVLRI